MRYIIVGNGGTGIPCQEPVLPVNIVFWNRISNDRLITLCPGFYPPCPGKALRRPQAACVAGVAWPVKARPWQTGFTREE